MTFNEHLKKYLDNTEIGALIDSFNEQETKGLVLNTRLISDEIFLKEFPDVEKHPLVPHAFIYKKSKYDFGKYDLFNLGAYYIQEPSAMLVSWLLNPSKNDLILDMCAAPGGKTNLANQIMDNEGLIVSNDISKSRTQILLSNVERMGMSNVVVSNIDFSKKYCNYRNYFDKIILDAPCSGSGMFRKSEEVKNDWTYEKVIKQKNIQSELLNIAATMVKVGGIISYSTCSYSYEENEEIILNFIKNNPNFETIKIPEHDGFFRSNALPDAIHLFPYLFNGEGHFICLLKKISSIYPNKCINKNSIEYIRKRIDFKNRTVYEMYKVNFDLNEDLLDLSLRPGLFLKEITNSKEIPSHQSSRCDNNLKSIQMDEMQYKKYIHGDTFNVDIENGFYTVKYLSFPVGLIHVVNNVAKNLYPKGLRH